MKHILPFLCLAAILAFTSCYTPQPQTINETDVFFLVDATDAHVFESIECDFNQNLNSFFVNTGIGDIGPGCRLTIRMGAIDDSDQLTVHSQSIAFLDKRVSRIEAERQRDPRPLLEMISGELGRYKGLSEQSRNSPILDCILKSLREMNPETREILVICTDGLENSRYGNFYKNLPSTPQSIERLLTKVDQILLAEARERIEEMDGSLEVVLVLVSNKSISPAKMKDFYYELLHNQLGISTLRFIDNFSQTPNI